MKRMVTAITVLLLSVLMVLSGNVGIAHAVEGVTKGHTYIADVLAFQGATMQECIDQCNEMGYTPTKKNLNEGAIEKVSFGKDKDAPCVMLGYLPTTNQNLAITNISLLHMGEGYEMRDFSSIAAALLEKNQSYAEGLAAAASEFAENYDKGAPSAVQAYKALDMLYVDDLESHTFEGYVSAVQQEMIGVPANERHEKLNELARVTDSVHQLFDWDDHVPLSQFISEGNADVEFFNKLLSYGTPSIINAVNTALCSGSADFENYYNPETQSFETQVWAERIRTDDARVIILEGLTTQEWLKFDAAYMDDARSLAQCLQDFATRYLDAKALGISPADELASMDDSEDIGDAIEDAENMEDRDLYWVYVAAYNILNQYHYSDDQLLGDWVVEMGKRAYQDEEDYRDLYPLVDVLSPSQLIFAKYCGFATLVAKMRQLEGSEQVLDEVYAQVVERLKKVTYEDAEYRISVWAGVDPSVYQGKVAMTSDAIRKAGAYAALQLTDTEKAAENAKVRNWTIGIVTSGIDAIAFLVDAAIAIKAGTIIHSAAMASCASMGGFWAGMVTFCSVLNWVGLIITLVVALTALVTWLYGLIKDELRDPSSAYTDMPTLVYESKNTAKSGNRIIKFTAIWEAFGSRVGDANGYTGNKWNCLYVSSDEDAGSPLVVQKGTDPFALKADPATPKGYEPVSLFGQIGAANLNDGAYDVADGRNNYLFYTTKKSLKALEETQSEGETTDAKDGLYIGDIVVGTGNTEERARAKIINKKGKYYVLDRNVGTKDAPAYLGYSLTNDKNDALKDIRVVSKESQTEIMFGSARYACAGNLPNGDGVYISSDSKVGTPILSELKCVAKREDAPKGWEPIVFMSGAPVYMFGGLNNECAVYFEPEVKYTSGDTYVGGIAFLSSAQAINHGAGTLGTSKSSGQQANSDDTKSMMDLAGWQDAGVVMRSDEGYRLGDPSAEQTMDNLVNIASGLSYSDINALQVFTEYYLNMNLMVAYTHNPYRAIYDASVYSSTNRNASGLSQCIGKGILINQNGVETNTSGYYAACEEVLSKASQAKDNLGSSSRGNHAYMSGKLRDVHSLYVKPYDDGSNCQWEFSRLIPRGLYVLGPVDGMEPLKPADVVVSDTPYDSANNDGNIGTTLPAQCRSIDGSVVEGQQFHSVQDVKHPFNLPAQNLSYPEFFDDEGESAVYDGDSLQGSGWASPSEPLYLYLRGTVRRPKYVSSVTVGTYDPDLYLADNPDTDEDIIDSINLMAEDTAWQTALAASNAGIINTNLSVKKGETWDTKSKGDKGKFADTDVKPTACYLGVSRTDDVSKAIRGFLLMEKSAVCEGTAPITNIEVRGKTKYTLPQGSCAIPMDAGSFYLYQSYNTSTIPGQPIKEISVDDTAFSRNMATVLYSDARGADAKPKGNVNLTNFIHCEYDRVEGDYYINALYVGRGKNLKDALLDAMAQGATEALEMDAIENCMTKTDASIAIGYRTLAATDSQKSLHERYVGTTKDPLCEAIRDIVITVGEPLKDELIIDGVLYKPASKTNLHEGLDAPEVYLYECMDYYSILHNKDDANKTDLVMPSLRSALSGAIARIGMASQDRVPYNDVMEKDADVQESLVRWENVLQAGGGKIDLNHALIIGDSHAFRRAYDNRKYLFVHRTDNSVKPGAEITGGHTTDTVTVGLVRGSET